MFWNINFIHFPHNYKQKSSDLNNLVIDLFDVLSITVEEILNILVRNMIV